MVHSTKTKLETKKILDIGKYRLRERAGWYCVLIGESNVAIDLAIEGYGVEDIYLGEFSPQEGAHGPLARASRIRLPDVGPGLRMGDKLPLPQEIETPL